MKKKEGEKKDKTASRFSPSIRMTGGLTESYTPYQPTRSMLFYRATLFFHSCFFFWFSFLQDFFLLFLLLSRFVWNVGRIKILTVNWTENLRCCAPFFFAALGKNEFFRENTPAIRRGLFIIYFHSMMFFCCCNEVLPNVSTRANYPAIIGNPHRETDNWSLWPSGARWIPPDQGVFLNF